MHEQHSVQSKRIKEIFRGFKERKAADFLWKQKGMTRQTIAGQGW
jgi:hypothetical protein